jgi:hypothetical protein
MLTEAELQQICRSYQIVCPVCATANQHYRLKRDMARAAKSEGDGHPTKWKWGKPGFDSFDPKQLFMGECSKCGFTGELEDAKYRTAGENPEGFKKDYSAEALQGLIAASSVGKGAAQSLLKRIGDDDPFGSTHAKIHLGILSQCLRSRIAPGTIARYYLRIAWLYRDKEIYYADTDLDAHTESVRKLRKRWSKELPADSDYPAPPDIVPNEVEALKTSRTFFERNYETLKEASQEDELRLRLLLAEIGFRLYELTNDEQDYKKAASFFSGTMQKCLSIISDKTIVGGLVNRAREMLEASGERGRELRALHKSRGGSDDESEGSAPTKKKEKEREHRSPATRGEKDNDQEGKALCSRSERRRRRRAAAG